MRIVRAFNRWYDGLEDITRFLVMMLIAGPIVAAAYGEGWVVTFPWLSVPLLLASALALLLRIIGHIAGE